MLAACGGSGGGAPSTGTIAPAPSPPTASPSPTPPPTPTPSLPPPSGPIALSLAPDYSTYVWGYRYTTKLDGTQGSLAADPSAAFEFHYLSTQQTFEAVIPGYRLGRFELASGFGPDFNSALFRKMSGTGRTFTLNLFKPGPSNPTLALRYTSVGDWEASRVDASDPTRIDQNLGLFAYGVATPTNQVPSAGTATYDAFLYGYGGWMEGNVHLTVDFAGKSITGSLEGLINDGIGGWATTGRYEFSGALTASDRAMFSGRFTIPGLTDQGSFEGRFTGPHASELMVRWQGRFYNPHMAQAQQFQGVWAGRRR